MDRPDRPAWPGSGCSSPARSRWASGPRPAFGTSPKGGSGKTTSSAHLAQRLALKGYRVLAIDLDPQASLSALFGYQPELDLAFSRLKNAGVLPTWMELDAEVVRRLAPVAADESALP